MKSNPNELWTVSIIVCGFEVSPKCRAKTKSEAIEKTKLVLREIGLDTMQQAIESKSVLNPVKRTLKGVKVSVNA